MEWCESTGKQRKERERERERDKGQENGKSPNKTEVIKEFITLSRLQCYISPKKGSGTKLALNCDTHARARTHAVVPSLITLM